MSIISNFSIISDPSPRHSRSMIPLMCKNRCFVQIGYIVVQNLRKMQTMSKYISVFEYLFHCIRNLKKSGLQMFQNETEWMENQRMRWKTLREKPKLWYANYTTWEKRIENLFILMYWIYISFSFKWVFNLFDSCVQRWQRIYLFLQFV